MNAWRHIAVRSETSIAMTTHQSQVKPSQAEIRNTHLHNVPGAWPCGVQDPRDGQADQDVKNVAADGRRNRHVAGTSSGDDDAGQQIGNGGTSSKHGKSHDDGWNSCRVSDDFRPRHHQVRECSDPKDGHDERKVAVLSPARPLHVRDGKCHDDDQRENDEILYPSQARSLLWRHETLPYPLHILFNTLQLAFVHDGVLVPLAEFFKRDLLARSVLVHLVHGLLNFLVRNGGIEGVQQLLQLPRIDGLGIVFIDSVEYVMHLRQQTFF
mmetsp:Transcript_18353/g.52421  ORF Transcript_18353/g.52421 Transcript_18353/m.52421 type:complete len:268 (-) Transcript_18353:2254-3057(-)